ncbi:hypothetical protein D3C87_1016640 [compost metagenome]
MVLAIPAHLALRRQRRLRQRLMQARAAQGFQNAHGHAFKRRKPAPFADQRDAMAQPPQSQRDGGTGRSGAKNDDVGHGPKRRSGPR